MMESIKSIKSYFYMIARTLVHELFGHGYIIQSTPLGQLSAGPITGTNGLTREEFSTQMQKLTRDTAKFTHEGWAEWISWFFSTHYDDFTLHDYFLPPNERTNFIYRDLETYQRFLKAFVRYVQTGHFEFAAHACAHRFAVQNHHNW